VSGRVVEINIAAEHDLPCVPHERIEVLAGQGVVGDRHFLAQPAQRHGNDLTVVDRAQVEAFVAESGIPLTALETRRNVVTEGIDVNDLVGKRFRVGSVEAVGIELCEPCNHLQSLTRPGVLRGMVHRAGLSADVLVSGAIAVGDELVVLD